MNPTIQNEPRKLGADGPAVFPIALGCMGMSGMYGPSDDNESIATIQEALDRGVQLIDTGDFYGTGHNEMLIGKALKGRRDKAVLSVKFGALRGPDRSWLGFNASPAAVKNSLAYSLVRLGVDYIDIYRPARLDPKVPIEDTVGAIAELVEAGYVRQIGLSEVGPETIKKAHAVHPICDLQIEYSPLSRGPEAEIFPLLESLGIAVTAYGVLSRGLISKSATTGAGDMRAHLPRFNEQNLPQNQKLIEALATIATEKGFSASQLAIAWVLSKGKRLIPTLGARRRTQLAETLGALAVKLSAEDVHRIEKAAPAEAVAGTRYDERQMQALDSEKKGN